MSRRQALWVPFALSLALWPLPAGAQPNPTARLELVRGPGAESCPGEQELRDAVAVRLGHDPFTPQAALHIVVRLSGAGTELLGELILRDGSGQEVGKEQFRERTGDCSRLYASVGLAASLALTPIRGVEARDQPTKQSRAPAAEPPVSRPQLPLPPPAAPAPSIAVLPAPSAAAPAPETSLWRYELSLGGAFAVGSAPSIAGGLVAGVAFGQRPWSIGAEIRGYFPESKDAAGGGSVETSLIAGASLACVEVDGPVPLFACGVVSAGMRLAEGAGVDVPKASSAPYLGIGGRVGFTFPVWSRFALRVHGDGAWTPLASELYLGEQLVWTTPKGIVGGGGELVAIF